MAKLYFKYGAMNCSKSASALMCRFNYIQKGMNVLLMKPAIDNREDPNKVVCRIGLSADCHSFDKSENLLKYFEEEQEKQKIDVVIVDECQFCTKKQVEQLRDIAESVPVLCYGLKTNFKTELFEGSKRFLELADSISEIKSVCDCGRKAIINGRFTKGILDVNGEEVFIAGNEKYKGLCYSCYKKEERKHRIYDKIIKHLKIFKNKDDAGYWSTDTSMDNIVLQKPYVIYDEEVSNFLDDFKEFQVKNPEKIIAVNDNLEDLTKLSVKGQSFDYMMALISCVLKFEKTKPGLLKALIENDVMTKWLKQIKYAVDNEEE